MKSDKRQGAADGASADRPLDFEEATYAYARAWAARTRRDFLKQAGAGLGAAALAMSVGLPGARAQTAGGTVRIARGQESDTLDPHKTALLVAHEVCWQIYDSLIYLDETGKVFPGVAQSWTFSEDHKAVTFKLRPNVKFHDGTPFNAEAVKFTVERHVNPATASPTGWILGPIDHVEVIDDLTCAYHYKAPFVALWVGLSYSYCAPVSPAAVKKFGDQFGRNPVGTGPFKFVAWQPDQGISLARNDEHDWATPMYANKGKPWLEGASYVVIPEDATRLAALASGDIDLVSGTDSVPVDKLKQLKDTKGLAIYTRPAVGLYYSYINTKIKPLDDVRVRKAINYAVDKQKIITLVLDGWGKPAYSPVGSAFADYNPAVEKIGYAHDPDKAKALMQEAGQQAGFTLDYLVIEGPAYRRVAEIIQQDLAPLNIKVNIQTFPVGELFAMAPKGKAGMVFFYYTYSDPDLIYALLKTGQAMSWAFQSDAELDGWLDQQRVEFDAAKRKALLYKVQERAVDQALWLYLYEGVYAAAMQDKLKGLTLDTVGFHHLQDLSLG
jgi:peptide/nickel transport system substrate-binding protein